jgi:hypothetical protein
MFLSRSSVGWNGMKTSSYRRSQRAASLFCLLAVALLYAPTAAAAWPTQSTDCCKNGMCSARVHHTQATPHEAMPMDCGHDMSVTAACSLSCCHTTDKPAVSPHIFVLPQVQDLAGPSEAVAPGQILKFSEVMRFLAPPSPPPRSLPRAQ